MKVMQKLVKFPHKKGKISKQSIKLHKKYSPIMMLLLTYCRCMSEDCQLGGHCTPQVQGLVQPLKESKNMSLILFSSLYYITLFNCSKMCHLPISGSHLYPHLQVVSTSL